MASCKLNINFSVPSFRPYNYQSLVNVKVHKFNIDIISLINYFSWFPVLYSADIFLSIKRYFFINSFAFSVFASICTTLFFPHFPFFSMGLYFSFISTRYGLFNMKQNTNMTLRITSYFSSKQPLRFSVRTLLNFKQFTYNISFVRLAADSTEQDRLVIWYEAKNCFGKRF